MAFFLPSPLTAATTRERHLLYNAYLDSLSASPPPPTTTATPSSSYGSTPTTSPATTGTLAHAPLSYFALDQLTSKGPRTTADWGTPHEATRKLADDGILRGGSWWCSQGGWPSPNPKAHTEIFYVCRGHGCLSDADGVKHYFGPGDTVIIPKGHTGRWDVQEDIHKVWAVNDHAQIEERGTPIRVKVIHFQDYHANIGAPTGYATTPTALSETIYNVGPTKVGIWNAAPGSVTKITQTQRFWFLILKGTLVLAADDDGTVQVCEPGDSVMLPQGWSGYVHVQDEPVKKLWTQAQ
eukprot:scaffold8602_cov196-Amphora_coffeaeformis.AAC.31